MYIKFLNKFYPVQSIQMIFNGAIVVYRDESEELKWIQMNLSELKESLILK